MNDTITMPRNLFDQIERVMRRLVAKVEPTDTEAKATCDEAVALIQTVTTIADNETTQFVKQEIRSTRLERSGAQALLDLAKKAERERWEGPSDLAENHDRYIAEAAEEDLQRMHDYSH